MYIGAPNTICDQVHIASQPVINLPPKSAQTLLLRLLQVLVFWYVDTYAEILYRGFIGRALGNNV